MPTESSQNLDVMWLASVESTVFVAVGLCNIEATDSSSLLKLSYSSMLIWSQIYLEDSDNLLGPRNLRWAHTGSRVMQRFAFVSFINR